MILPPSFRHENKFSNFFLMNYTEYQFSISPLEPWREILMALLAECEFDSFVDTENGMEAYVKTELEDQNSILEQIWVCKLHQNRFKESKNLSLSKQTQLHKNEYAISAPI